MAAAQVHCLQLAKQDFNDLVLTARRREWSTLIRSWPLFVTLKEATRAHILEHMNYVKCNQGEAIVRQGDKGGRFYIIKEGARPPGGCGRSVPPRGRERARAEFFFQPVYSDPTLTRSRVSFSDALAAD